MSPGTFAIHRRPVHLAVLAALASGAACQARAQDAAAPPPPAASAVARGGNDAPQEVVISAQKRTERLKDTPVAASVVSDQLLEKANATDISDINKLVPSVELKGSYNGRVPYAMRGISTTANEQAVGLTSGVSIMIDGVPVPSDSTAANELQDILRVEVLKGPQSTLGGRTASAGVINFVTRTPSKHWQGGIDATLTNDNERRASGFVSGPLSDAVSFSASTYASHRQYLVENILLGEHSHSDAFGGRGKLQISPDRDLDITFTARTAAGTSIGETFTYQYITPGATLFPLFPWNTAGIAQSVALGGVTPSYGNTKYASPVPMSAKTHDQDLSLTLEKRFGDYSFTSTTAQQKEAQHLVQDVPMVAVRFLDILRQPVVPDPPIGPALFDDSQHWDITPKSLTQEFRIASPTDGFVSYVAGLFYSKVDVSEESLRQMFVNPLDSTILSKTESLGLYGRATWTLAPATSLLTGLRLNHDKVAYSIDDRALGYASSGADSSNATVGDLTLRQKLGKDRMVYATYARGYKPRAFNTAQTLTSNDALQPVAKESIDHFELGAKGTFLGGALSLDAAAFSTRYRDYQVQIYDNSSIISLLELSNAGQAQTRGLELDATLNSSSTGTLFHLGGAFIDARFVRYQGAPCYPTQTSAQGCATSASGSTSQDLSGKQMPDSPRLKLNASVDQSLPEEWLPWGVRLNANYAYRTKANFQADNNPETVQKAFGLLNLGATFSSPDGRHAITTFVNNVTNKYYLVNAEDFFAGLWNANAVIGQPARDAHRYFGVKYSLYFD
jgi:iron complex outermembrane receptor protein